MLTGMTEENWSIMLELFDGCSGDRTGP